MNQKYGVIEFALSFIILSIVVFSLGFVYKKRYYQSHTGIILKAEFDSVDGLTEGAPVKINGVTVGTVKSINLDPQTFAAVVTFVIRKSLHLPKDTTASVVSPTLFSNKVMVLLPGSEEEFLNEGETIYRTLSSMNIEDFIQKLLFNTGGDHDNKNPERREPKEEDKDEEQRGDGTAYNNTMSSLIWNDR